MTKNLSQRFTQSLPSWQIVMSKKFKFGSPASLSKDEFVDKFGGIYEYSAWIAERAYEFGISKTHDEIEQLAKLLRSVFMSALSDEKFGVIIAHPDLAGKAARSGELTEASTNEQASAGIDTLSEEEFEKFTVLNNAYKNKFNFPFIKAVKGSNKHEILAGFRERIRHTREDEIQTAYEEINKIAMFRLAEL